MLIPSEARATVLGVGEADVRVVTHPLVDGSAAGWQGGTLECWWAVPLAGSPERTAGNLSVAVLPRAGDAYHAFAEAFAGPDISVDSLGTTSQMRCSAEEDGGSCSGSLLIDDYWAEFSFRNFTIGSATQDEVLALGVVAGTAIRDALSAAGEARAAFVPAPDSLEAWGSCDDLDDGGQLREALDSPSLLEPEGQYASGDGEGIAMFSVSWTRAGFASCSWSQKDMFSSPPDELRLLSTLMLPGGAWAWPEISAHALSQAGAQEVQIDGADAAIITCSVPETTGCKVLVLAGGSWLSVDAGYPEGSVESSRETALEAAGLLLEDLR